MSTNLPQYSPAELSGDISEFKKTILKRGEATITMTGTTGTVSVDITDLYNTAALGILNIEVAHWRTSGGAVTVTPLPYVYNSGASVIRNAVYDIQSAVGAGGYTYTLVISYYKSTGVSGDTEYFEYVIYSQTMAPYFTGINWNYRK